MAYLHIKPNTGSPRSLRALNTNNIRNCKNIVDQKLVVANGVRSKHSENDNEN